MGLYPAPKGPPPSPGIAHALAPFVGVSALAATLMTALVGALFLVPLWWAGQQGWTGTLPWWPLLVLAPLALAWMFAASKKGIERQLRPLGQVASVLAERTGAAPVVHGRLRRGWGVSVAFPDPSPAGGPELRVVAARGQRSRPELYLVRGEREHHFREPRDPLPELEEALRAVGAPPGPSRGPGERSVEGGQR